MYLKQLIFEYCPSHKKAIQPDDMASDWGKRDSKAEGEHGGSYQEAYDSGKHDMCYVFFPEAFRYPSGSPKEANCKKRFEQIQDRETDI